MLKHPAGNTPRMKPNRMKPHVTENPGHGPWSSYGDHGGGTSTPLMVRGLGGSPTYHPLPHPRASPTPAPRMYSGGLSTAMAKLVHRANVACPSHEASTPASSRHRDCRWVARASPAPSTVTHARAWLQNTVRPCSLIPQNKPHLFPVPVQCAHVYIHQPTTSAAVFPQCKQT